MAILSQGTLIKRGNADGPPETFTTIGKATGWSGPGRNRAEIRTTHLESTFHEFLMDIPDGGEFTVQVDYDPADATHANLDADVDSATQRNFQIVYKSTPVKTRTFAAYVRDFTSQGQVGDAVRGTLTLRITGVVTTA